MSAVPPANASACPKISSARRYVSMVLLVISLVIGVIEVRAGLGQFLTMRAFSNVSTDNAFKEVSFADAERMIVGFPAESPVEELPYENIHHYHWYSLLRPLTGKKSPELFVTSDHRDPPRAVTYYTSTEDFSHFAHDPPAPDFSGAAERLQSSTSDTTAEEPAGDVDGTDGSQEAR